MADENFGQTLDKLSNLWSETKPQSMDLINDGTYQFRIDSCELTSIADKDNPAGKIPCVITKYICLTESFKDKIVTSWDRLNKKESIQFFKEKLRRLGINPMVDLNELEIHLKDIVGCLVTAKITNKPGTRGDMIFTNIFIQSNDGKSDLPF